jgi:RNA polymerase sigma-70 factor (ECF subfamily)
MRAEDFHNLYERYASDVFRFAMYLCRNRAQAEDITAETFVRVWTTSGEIRVATVKAYLLTIARNLYLSDLRRSVREVALEEAGQVPDYEGNLACHADQKAALAHVLQALGQLKENDRAVLLMRAQDEMSYEQIAQALGLSMVAVKVRIHRARLRLAELCQRKEGRA